MIIIKEEKIMKKIMKKVLSLVLVMVMVFSPMTAWADVTPVEVQSGTVEFSEETGNVGAYVGDPWDGIVYIPEESGALNIDVTNVNPGSQIIVRDLDMWSELAMKTSTADQSIRVYVTEGVTYGIAITAYDPTVVEHPMWGPTEVGPVEGSLTYSITFEAGATPAPGEVEGTAIAVNLGGTVNVDAGKTVWYSIPADAYTPYTVDVRSAVAGFEVFSAYDYATAYDEDGSLSANLTGNDENKIVFSITNTSNSNNSYVINAAELFGVWNNPYMIYGDGEHTANLVVENGSSSGCHYTWTADAPGVVTITMTCDEWTYNFGDYTQHYSDGDSEWVYNEETGEDELVDLGINPSSSVQVEAEDIVEFWVNSYDEETFNNPADGVVAFKITFEPGAVLEDDGSVNGPEDEINKTYKNTVTPEKFTLTLGEGDVIKNINVIDGVIEKAVLGADGYYHLNTEDGPVLLANIGSKAPYNRSITAAAGENRLYVSEYKDGTLVKRTDYNKAVSAYAKCMDTERGLYPLTDDLMTVLKEYGAFQSWYKNIVTEDGDKLNTSIFNTTDENTGVTTYVEGDENAWMFACCYVEPAEEATVLEGKDSTWTQGTDAPATVRFDAEFDMFKAVRVDGKLVDPANYEVKEGSILENLKLIDVKSKFNIEAIYGRC